jgi:hypothetical protein
MLFLNFHKPVSITTTKVVILFKLDVFFWGKYFVKKYQLPAIPYQQRE